MVMACHCCSRCPGTWLQPTQHRRSDTRHISGPATWLQEGGRGKGTGQTKAHCLLLLEALKPDAPNSSLAAHLLC